jgi:hypothetical protein
MHQTQRYAEATLLQIGLLFSGGGDASYKEVCNADAVGMHGFRTSTNQKYFKNWYHAAETLWKRSQKRCLERMEAAGRSQDLVALFYGSWLHRGYASQQGTQEEEKDAFPYGSRSNPLPYRSWFL